MRCGECGVVVVDGHQCDPAAVEAKRKAREEWRRGAEEDRRLEALKGLSERRPVRPPKIAGTPLGRGGQVARQRTGGAKTR